MKLDLKPSRIPHVMGLDGKFRSRAKPKRSLQLEYDRYAFQEKFQAEAEKLRATKAREPLSQPIAITDTKKRQEALAGRPKSDKCEVCGNSERIVWDHCHASGNFRGWICHGCNVALGMTKDNPQTLRALADYLEKSQRGK